MTISNKLVLMATLGLVFGSQLRADDYYAKLRAEEEIKTQNIFSFAINLRKQNNNNAQTAADWLEKELLSLHNRYYTLDKITIILNSNLSFEKKTDYILQVKAYKDKEIADSKAQDEIRNIRWDEENKERKYNEAQKIRLQNAATAAANIIPALLYSCVILCSVSTICDKL